MPSPFGIDEALLAVPSQPPALQPAPAPVTDPLAAALQALQDTGMVAAPLQPSLYTGDPHDTDLEPLPQDPVGPTGPAPVQNTPDFPLGAADVPAGWEAVVQGEPGHLSPGQPTSHRAQSLAESAAHYRQVQLDDPRVPLAPGDVAGATYREDRAVEAAGLAKAREAVSGVNEQNDIAARTAQVFQNAAHDAETEDYFYQQQRQAIQRDADAETAAWMQEYTDLAAKEPNPDRWWENRTGLAKALWGLSMVFGSAHSAITPGAQNVALNMVMDNIRQDIQLQKERLGKQLTALKAKGETMDRRHQRNLTDLTDDHSMALGRLATMVQAYKARAQAPGAAGLQAGLAAADSWFAEQTLKVAGSKREQAVQIREHELARQHAWAMQSRTLARDYDLAALRQENAALKAGVEAKQNLHKGEVRISPETGALVVDKKTGRPVGDPGDEGAIWVNEKLEPAKVQATITAANQEASDLQLLYDALKDESSWASIVAGTNTDAIQAMARLKQSRVAGQGGLGHTTDRDMSVVEGAVSGASTADIGDRFKLAFTRGKVLEALQRTINDHKAEVDNKLSPYAPPGARIDWSPQATRAPSVRGLTQDEQIAELGGTPKAPAPITTPEQLRQARARGEDPRRTGTVAAGQYKPILDRLEQNLKGSSPDHIRAMAEAALNAVAPDPWHLDSSGQQDKPGSTFAHDAYIPAVVEDALKDAEKRRRGLVRELVSKARGTSLKQFIHGDWRSVEKGAQAPSRAVVEDTAVVDYGFSNLSPDDIDALIADVNAALKKK